MAEFKLQFDVGFSMLDFKARTEVELSPFLNEASSITIYAVAGMRPSDVCRF